MPKVCVCISIYDINTKIHPFPFPSLSLTKHSCILLTSDSSLSLLWPTYIWNLFWGTCGPSTIFLKSLIRKKNPELVEILWRQGVCCIFSFSSCYILLVDIDIKTVLKVLIQLLKWKVVSGNVLSAYKAARREAQFFVAGGSWTLELYRALSETHMCG